MRAFVFTDPALTEQAGRFVWLAINTEKSKNASLRKKYPMPAIPTFFVLNPDDEKVVLRWVGGATVPQLQKILDDGRLAVAAAAHPAPGNGPSGEADALLARADKLYGAGEDAEAAKVYQAALAHAPTEWPRYSRAVESLLFALAQTDANEPAARLARDAYPRLSRTPSAANVAATGLDCALAIPADSAGRAELVQALEADARAVVSDSTVPVAADDRSAVYIALLDAREDAKDDAGRLRCAEQWSAFLDGVAARAKTPDQRAAFDPHRLSAYIEIGHPERAIPMLEASERDFPGDYNPPARLANAYKAMKRWDDALAASDRALARAYGPRKLTMMQARSDIYVGRGDKEAAKRTLAEAVSYAEALPDGQRSDQTIANLKKKLGALQ